MSEPTQTAHAAVEFVKFGEIKIVFSADGVECGHVTISYTPKHLPWRLIADALAATRDFDGAPP